MIHFQNRLLTWLGSGNLSYWLHETLHRVLLSSYSVAANVPQNEDLRESRWGGSLSAFCPLVSKIAHCLFSSILFARSESLSTSHSKRERISLHHLKGELSKNVGAYFKATTSTIYLLKSHILPSTYLLSFLSSYVS